MSEEETGPTNSEEYQMMLTLEQLESLEEELEEVGFGTLGEIEAVLALTPPSGTDSSDERRNLLLEIRDQMLELNVDNLREIHDHIRKLHQQLDEMEEE